MQDGTTGLPFRPEYFDNAVSSLKFCTVICTQVFRRLKLIAIITIAPDNPCLKIFFASF